MAKVKKLGDFITKTGEYQDRNGQTKNRWVTGATLFENIETGKWSISIPRTFNPAGVPCDSNSETLWLMFKAAEDKNKDGQSNGGYQGYQGGNNGGYHDGFYGPNTYSPPPDPNFGKSYDPYAPGDPSDVPF